MNAHRHLGPSLSDVCPAFKAKIAEYERVAKTDPHKAQQMFQEAQVIAREFRDRERAGA
jgi:hypothetical protein